MSFEEIREAVLTMDDRSFSEQHLKQMEMYAPEMSEVRHPRVRQSLEQNPVRQILAYKRFEGDVEKLSKADRFSMIVSGKVSGFNKTNGLFR